MRIAVDAHAVGRRLTGNEVYIRNLVHWLTSIDRESEFIVYYSVAQASGELPSSALRRRVARNPFLRLGAELSWRLWRDRPDLIHVQYTAPLGCPAPVIVSVHDVSFLTHPEYFSPVRALQLRTTVTRTVRRASRILTPSEFSRRELIRTLGLPEEKVVHIPNGIARSFRPGNRRAAIAQVERKHRLGAPFLLVVGDIHPRKNQLALVEAFGELLRAEPHLPHHLVLAGKGEESNYGRLLRRSVERLGLSRRVHLPGYVSDEELTLLYQACELFVFPSHYEGFGLPILEAMACGRAVACSGATAIPEVADGAAIFFDPNSSDSIVRALRDLLLDAELRARMERLGMQRAAQFDWQETARRTLQVYREAAEDSMRPKAAARLRRPSIPAVSR